MSTLTKTNQSFAAASGTTKDARCSCLGCDVRSHAPSNYLGRNHGEPRPLVDCDHYSDSVFMMNDT